MLTHRDRFFTALQGQPIDRVSVFPLLMFFAADRAGLTHREYATNGRALAAAQQTAQEHFDLDAIPACSDAFRLSADLGGEMAYPEHKPPHLNEPIVRSRRDVETLGHPDPLQPIISRDAKNILTAVIYSRRYIHM